MGLRFNDAQLARAYNRVRDELRDVGLLVDGSYLDDIECYAHYDPLTFLGGELGRVYDDGVHPLADWVGFKPGMIYVCAWGRIECHVPGGTLVDVIRHEFAHAWAWRDRPYLRRPWFRTAFGAAYGADAWTDPDESDREAYVSAYAATQAKEDFAETFMVYLRDRKNLAKYRNRTELYRKLCAVSEAVSEAASTRVLTARRPRA